ncbi:MAG: hypothetical protein DHS80DRAFT_31191 [Piptocephalis tieghemiana]|nr:MAG: hypothetical protein DHS80DRAFT_31191 [Piptocephalis tieghemiana]
MSQEPQSLASRRMINGGKEMRVITPSPLSHISPSPKTAPGGGRFTPLSPLATSTPSHVTAHGPPPPSPRIIHLMGQGAFSKERRPSMPHGRRASLTTATLTSRPRRGSVTVASVTPSGDVIIRERRESIKASMPTREVCRRKAARKHRRHRAIHIPKPGEAEEGSDHSDLMASALKSPTLNKPPALNLGGGGGRVRDGSSSGPGGYFKPLPSPRVNASFTFGVSKTPSMDRYIRKPSNTQIGVAERRDLRTANPSPC